MGFVCKKSTMVSARALNLGTMTKRIKIGTRFLHFKRLMIQFMKQFWKTKNQKVLEMEKGL